MPKIYLLIVLGLGSIKLILGSLHKSLEPKIFNEKVEVLFDSFIL